MDIDPVLAAAVEQYGTSTANLNARIALHARFSTASRPWPLWLYDQIAPRNGETVLDVGAGTGMLWSLNAHRLPPSVRLHLSDLSPAMCSALAGSLPSQAGSCVVRADLRRLPYPTGAVDVVVANHVLYHVPDPVAALRELRRVLRPGGRAIMATNGRDHLRELSELLAAAGIGTVAPAPHLAFPLEDGGDAVNEVFAEVRTVRLDDRLQVTEAEPLLAYVTSMGPVAADGLAALACVLNEILTRDGTIRITKSSGVVIAR